jgi:hypothetical protein
MNRTLLRFTFLAALALSARAEDCFNGPSNIRTDRANLVFLTVPKGHSLRIQFTFNGDWENMVFLCTSQTSERIAVKGNYPHETGRDSQDFITPVDRDRDIQFVIAGFHKKTSPTDSHAADYAWRQSKMTRLPNQARNVEVYGFNDEGGNLPDNARVTVTKVGFE